MPKLIWNAPGKRGYETGIDRGVLYLSGQPGVPWNGITGVTDKPLGGDAASVYYDGQKVGNQAGATEYSATLEAFMYPDEFAVCDGSALINGLAMDNQERVPFGLSYRTKLGNDLNGQDAGYKVHLIYNALAKPSERAYSTQDSSAKALTFSWDLSTTPVTVQGRRATAHLSVDSTKTDPYLMAAFEELIYGNSSAAGIPTLPTMDQVVALFTTWVTLQVVVHPDGTFTASGPDPVVHFLASDPNKFEISWHSANPVDALTYTVSSA